MIGQGTLLSVVQLDDADVADFSRWSDSEHIVERIRIPGFIEGRRYVSDSAPVKHLSIYRTESPGVLDSAPYRAALANQTQWSLRNIARFRNVQRSVARVSTSRGAVQGAWVALLRLRPVPDCKEELQARIRLALDRAVGIDGVLCARVLECDPLLSKPLGAKEPPPGAGDWYVVVDAVDSDAARKAIGPFRSDLPAEQGAWVSMECFHLASSLSRTDLAGA